MRQPPAVALVLVASGLTAPVVMTWLPDGTGLIADQTGIVRVMTTGYELLAEPFLDIRDKLVGLNPNYDERGLLGLVLHPKYATNGRLYVYYSAPLRRSAPAGFDHTSRLSEWKVSSDHPHKADPASERILLEVDEPQSNHNGGWLAFGPDGEYLFIALGDGGGAGDIGPGHTVGLGNAQDLSSLLGSILRIDVDHGTPYGIPPDNPFAGNPIAAPIYAYGLRNPYRFSFDMGGNQALYVGDAGQNLWEEVSIVRKGDNCGWNIFEGTHCFNRQDFSTPLDHCARTGAQGEPLRWPIIEFPNARQKGGIGTAAIGGYVYQGQTLDELRGHYLFGTFSKQEGVRSGAIFAASAPDAENHLWPFQSVRIAAAPGGELGHYVKGFAQDSAGEIYVLTSDSTGPTGNTGKIFSLGAP